MKNIRKIKICPWLKSIQRYLEFPCKPEEGAVRGAEGRQRVRSERERQFVHRPG